MTKKEILRTAWERAVADGAVSKHLNAAVVAAIQDGTMAPYIKAVKQEEDAIMKYVEIVNALKQGKLNVVTFGSYPQGANGEVAPIEWRVLAVKEDKALLLSRYGLDMRPYDLETEDEFVTWDICSLRTWLNKDFLNRAFSKGGEKTIITMTVDNCENQNDGIPSGCNTEDKIFLLSYAEAEMYFKDDNDRKCVPTEYMAKLVACECSSSWWLRSFSGSECSARIVSSNGYLWRDDYVNCCNLVRPAMWVDLKCLCKHQHVNEILPYLLEEALRDAIYSWSEDAHKMRDFCVQGILHNCGFKPDLERVKYYTDLLYNHDFIYLADGDLPL